MRPIIMQMANKYSEEFEIAANRIGYSKTLRIVVKVVLV